MSVGVCVRGCIRVNERERERERVRAAQSARFFFRKVQFLSKIILVSVL